MLTLSKLVPVAGLNPLRAGWGRVEHFDEREGPQGGGRHPALAPIARVADGAHVPRGPALGRCPLPAASPAKMRHM